MAALALPSAMGETLLHYDFSDNGGTRVEDLSGNDNNGTLVGFLNTAAGGGQFNVSEGWVTEGGLSLLGGDEVQSYVQTDVPMSALYDGTANKDFTIEYSANFTGTSTWAPMIGSDVAGFDTNRSFYLGLNSSNGSHHVLVPGAGGGSFGANPWFFSPDETIHHVALAFDATAAAGEIFVDGVSQGSMSLPGVSMNVEDRFRVSSTGWAATETWGGIIHGVAISDEKLAPNNFVLPFTPGDGTGPTEPIGTLLHYRFDENSGTIATDLSGQGNDGTLTGFADTSPGAGQYGTSEGWVDGGGLSMLDDTVRSFVETPLPLSALEGQDFTVEFTGNLASADNWTPVFGSNQGTGGEFGDGWSGVHGFYFGLNPELTQAHLATPGPWGGSGDPPDSNPWGPTGDETLHHMAVTYNHETGEVTYYIDGEALPETFDRSGTSFLSNRLFRIGNTGWADAEQWAGVLTGVAISDVMRGPGSFVLLSSPVVLGDVNLDGVVNGLDVDPFVGLVTSGTFQVEGDMNLDGVVNGLDVDPFVAVVVGGGSQAVPEPTSLVLLAIAGLGLLLFGKRQLR